MKNEGIGLKCKTHSSGFIEILEIIILDLSKYVQYNLGKNYLWEHIICSLVPQQTSKQIVPTKEFRDYVLPSSLP
jgi:hypothetical protein